MSWHEVNLHFIRSMLILQIEKLDDAVRQHTRGAEVRAVEV